MKLCMGLHPRIIRIRNLNCLVHPRISTDIENSCGSASTDGCIRNPHTSGLRSLLIRSLLNHRGQSTVEKLSAFFWYTQAEALTEYTEYTRQRWSHSHVSGSYRPALRPAEVARPEDDWCRDVNIQHLLSQPSCINLQLQQLTLTSIDVPHVLCKCSHPLSHSQRMSFGQDSKLGPD